MRVQMATVQYGFSPSFNTIRVNGVSGVGVSNISSARQKSLLTENLLAPPKETKKQIPDLHLSHVYYDYEREVLPNTPITTKSCPLLIPSWERIAHAYLQKLKCESYNSNYYTFTKVA